MSSDDDHREIEQPGLGDDDNLIALRKAWDRALRTLATRLNKWNIENFLRPLKPLSYDCGIVVMGAPSAFIREWVDKKYAQMIREALEQHLDASMPGKQGHQPTSATPKTPSLPVSGGVPRYEPGWVPNAPLTQVRFVISKPDIQPILGEKPEKLKLAGHPDAKPPYVPDMPPAVVSQQDSKNPFFVELSKTVLNDKFTFDTLVAGKSNRLAKAGAEAVAANPGNVYNPLFIYGSPGLGKTHLMHAIGHEIRRRQPGARVVFISGETFTNHYVASLRDKRTEEFRRAYRTVDVLLVDDIQMIASAERTKEEFFHTFNTLHQMNKQIVITCDRSPRELRSMDERITSRFESGLIADVSPPDLAMRSEILQQKAERENLPIPKDVVEYMANLIQSNIRALEGALIKLSAYASVARSPVTRQLASDVLSGYFVGTPSTDREVSPAGASADQVIDAVAVHLGVDRKLILEQGSRDKNITFARQVAMYLCREMTKSSMTMLAQTFGCRNHSAIAHAHARLGTALDNDPKILATVDNIRTVIKHSL